MLEKQRGLYERDGVFSPRMVDGVISNLRSFGDADMRARLKEDPELEKELVLRYYHCG